MLQWNRHDILKTSSTLLFCIRWPSNKDGQNNLLTELLTKSTTFLLIERVSSSVVSPCSCVVYVNKYSPSFRFLCEYWIIWKTIFEDRFCFLGDRICLRTVPADCCLQKFHICLERALTDMTSLCIWRDCSSTQNGLGRRRFSRLAPLLLAANAAHGVSAAKTLPSRANNTARLGHSKSRSLSSRASLISFFLVRSSTFICHKN